MPSGNLHSGGEKRRKGRNLYLCIRTRAHAILSLFSSLYSLPTIFLWLYHLYTDSFQCTALPHNHFLWDSAAYPTSQLDVSQTSWSQYIKIGTHNGPSPNLVLNTQKNGTTIPPTHLCRKGSKFANHSWLLPFPYFLSPLNHRVLSILPSISLILYSSPSWPSFLSKPGW